MRIIFIGGGNIAKAIFSKLDNYEVIVTQHNLVSLEKLKQDYPNIKLIPKLNFTTTKEDIICFCVKPQDAKEACKNIANLIQSSTVISVMAGISCSTISSWLKNKQVCRIMPNTLATIGMSASGIYFTPEISNISQEIIIDIFAKIGHTYILKEEDQINQITAISGSAPAYVFYFIETLINSAIKQFKFSPETIKDITLQVIKGSVVMIEQSKNISIHQLRQNVTSKKGTTEQAISIFEKNNFTQIINEAHKSCYLKAQELSQSFNN